MIRTHIFKLWQGALKLTSVCWLVCLSVLQKLQNFTEIYKTLQNSTKHYKTLQNNRIRSFGPSPPLIYKDRQGGFGSMP